MVRILGCALFRSQDVFSTVHEPFSLCSTETRLFVATEQCFIHVYDLDENGCPEIHKFPTASLVKQIYHTDIGNTLVCLEEEHTIKHVRVYNGWQVASDSPMKVRFAGRAFSQPLDDDEPARMVVSEIQLKNSPSCIALDPSIARLAIIVGHVIMVYSQMQVLKNSYKVPITDYRCDFEIHLEMKIDDIAICQNYIAVASKDEIKVLRFVGHSAKTSKQVFHKSKSKQETSRTSSLECFVQNGYSAIPNKATDEEEVFDENGIHMDKNHFMWTPALLEPQKNCDNSISEDIMCNNMNVSTMFYKNLHSYKFDRRYNRQEEITTENHDDHIKVKSPQGAYVPSRCMPQVSSCLYKRFRASDVPLHSLQFVPVYRRLQLTDDDALKEKTEDGTEQSKKKPSLCSLSLFVSGSREGYLYQIKDDIHLLATYAYSGDCWKVMTTDHCIHAVTSTGLETHMSKAIPAALHDMLKVDNKNDTLPPMNLETYILSLQPFIGVQAATCTNQCVVLMSKVEEDDWCMIQWHWSLYCLKTADAVSLYHEMLETGSRYQQLSPHAYLHLLQEAHLLLRSAQLVAPQPDPILDDLIKESSRSLAEEYASPEAVDWYLALPFFRLSGMSPAEIICTQMQKGIIRTLDGGISQGFQHWLEHTLVQSNIHKDTELMKALDNISKILPVALRSLLPANIMQIKVI